MYAIPVMFETETGFEAKWGQGSWREVEINLTAGRVGVYQLVDGPRRVLYVRFAKPLRSVVFKYLRKGDIPRVQGFRWAEYRSLEEVEEAQDNSFRSSLPIMPGVVPYSKNSKTVPWGPLGSS